MGVSDGVWECGKPKRFSIISMPQSEGEKGEVTFSLRPRRGCSLAPLFPLWVCRMCEKRCKEWRISKRLWNDSGSFIRKRMSIWKGFWSR